MASREECRAVRLVVGEVRGRIQSGAVGLSAGVKQTRLCGYLINLDAPLTLAALKRCRDAKIFCTN